MKKVQLSGIFSLTICFASMVKAGDHLPLEPAASHNVILIIGDGMDDAQITIARNYLVGAAGKLLLDTLPVRSAVQVLTLDENDPSRPIYVADSANSATALATGQTTSIGRIATTAKTDLDIPTIAEQAKAAGLKVGIVTTASITDATPAAFISHINARGCENPTMMVDASYYGVMKINCSADTKAKGGLGSIAEQIADSPYDIVMGGGLENFDLAAESGGNTVLEQASNNGFYVVQQAAQLRNLPRDKKILGLFAKGHLPVRWRGENNRVAEAVGRNWLSRLTNYLGSVELPEPMVCEANPDYIDTPSLKSMTESALDLLAGDKGFFLMVESASIDKQSHKRNACGQIGELEQLLETLQVALDFAALQPNTLVLVTADHGQAAQLIPDNSLFADAEFAGATPGLLARVRTPEGGVMAVNYATNTLVSEEHTGVTVPLSANTLGLGRVPAMVQQWQIYHIMAQYLGLAATPTTGVL